MASDECRTTFLFNFYPENALKDSTVPPYETMQLFVRASKKSRTRGHESKWHPITLHSARSYLAFAIGTNAGAHMHNRLRQLNEYNWFGHNDNERYEFDHVFLPGTVYEVDIVLEGEDDKPLPDGYVPAPIVVSEPKAEEEKAVAAPVAVAGPADQGEEVVRQIIKGCKGNYGKAVSRILSAVTSDIVKDPYASKVLAVVRSSPPSSQMVAELLSIK